MADLFILLSILFFGVGAFLGKSALRDASSVYVYLFEALGTLTIATIIAFFFKKELGDALNDFSWQGYLFGLFFGLGTATFIVALKYKDASAVVPLTALYPLVTILLATVFLHEAITLKVGIGIMFAIIAGFLLL